MHLELMAFAQSPHQTIWDYAGLRRGSAVVRSVAANTQERAMDYRAAHDLIDLGSAGRKGGN